MMMTTTTTKVVAVRYEGTVDLVEADEHGKPVVMLGRDVDRQYMEDFRIPGTRKIRDSAKAQRFAVLRGARIVTPASTLDVLSPAFDESSPWPVEILSIPAVARLKAKGMYAIGTDVSWIDRCEVADLVDALTSGDWADVTSKLSAIRESNHRLTE